MSIFFICGLFYFILCKGSVLLLLQLQKACAPSGYHNPASLCLCFAVKTVENLLCLFLKGEGNLLCRRVDHCQDPFFPAASDVGKGIGIFLCKDKPDLSLALKRLMGLSDPDQLLYLMVKGILSCNLIFTVGLSFASSCLI